MLHVAATPIGNLDDITPRALAAFREASLVACEDTRRTWQLLSAFSIPRPEMVSYREGNEERMADAVIEAVRSGREVVLCSDGGYPAISDPGYRLLSRCAERGVEYDVLPGASAVLTALVASALPTSSFVFKGFPPRQGGAARRFFEEDASARHTLVIYESPFRTAKTLALALEALGDRRAAVCIELTKAHERVERGWLSELAAKFGSAPPKGEVAIVIAGSNPKFSRQLPEDATEGKETKR